MKTILVPIDFTESSNPTVEAAFSLVQDIHVSLVFLHVEPPPASINFTTRIEESWEEKSPNTEDRLRAIVRRAQDQGIIASFLIVSGQPIEQILRYADEFNAELIVMGSHHHDLISGSRAGRTFQEVLRKTRCPLVLVPAGKSARHSSGGSGVVSSNNAAAAG
jgi:nucleotide-binding universal stress UspA family protein